MRSRCCPCVCVCVYVSVPPHQLSNAEPIFTKLGMYVMAPEPISVEYFLNPSQQSVCVFLLSLLSNGSVKTLPRQRIYTQQ
jgi:hypothetical protein